MAGSAPNAVLSASQLPLAVSIGDPAGIGPEIILKSWMVRNEKALKPFAVMGGADHLRDLAGTLQLDVAVEECRPDEVAGVFANALPVVALQNEASILSQPGVSAARDAALVSGSIVAAVQGCFDGSYGGLVTAPINKKALYDAGFAFAGHTEFLAELASRQTGRKERSVMMLAGPDLRTVPVTIHIPLLDVPAALTTGLIVETCKIVTADLTRRFGMANPRLAISGLNPHAGESGAMGREDLEVIVPAVGQLNASGITAFGPLPADTMFHARARETYDVAICMYHDQALIPAKTLAFDEAVNVTLGLPFIRTSPDHGTAYDIAGKGIANASSMVAALQMAGEMASLHQDAMPHRAVGAGA